MLLYYVTGLQYTGRSLGILNSFVLRRFVKKSQFDILKAFDLLFGKAPKNIIKTYLIDLMTQKSMGFLQ